MRIIMLVFFTMWLFSSGHCQSLYLPVFNENGLVKQLVVKNNKIIPPVSVPVLLKQTDSITKKQARQLLLAKVQEAARVIKSNYYKSSLHRLVLDQGVWKSDSLKLINYLTFIENALINGRKITSPDNFYSPFTASFNRYLADDTLSCFTAFLATNGQKLELIRINPFNAFVTDFYNSLLDLTTLPGVLIKKEDIIETTYRLLDEKMKVDLLLKQYRKLDTFRISFYDSLKRTHQQVNANSAVIKQTESLFKSTWFQHWFWYRGGEIRINPLDITTNDTVSKYKFRDLLDSNTIKNLTIRSDLFLLENRLDTLSELQRVKDSLLFKTQALVNTVTIPAQNPYYNYSANSDIKLEVNDCYITKSSEVKLKKKLVVHNIPSGWKAGLLEKDIAFEDKSPFQIGLDTVLGSLGQLAALYAKFTSYAGVLNFFLPKSKLDNSKIEISQVKPSKQSNNEWKIQKIIGEEPSTFDTVQVIDSFKLNSFAFYFEKNRQTSFRDNLKYLLLANNIFDESEFNLVFKGKPSMDEVKIQRLKYQDTLSGYLNAIMFKEAMLLLHDSIKVSAYLNIYNRSTPPVLTSIQTITDRNSFFYSKTLETSPVLKPKEKDVTVFTFNAKDSAFIDKFTYKIGDRYRFRLSAGIAYTLNAYNQSKAVEEGNNITITNNVQLYRLIVGLHIYLGKGLYNQDSRFFSGDIGRNYFYFGLGIPDPLGNIYVGLGRDLVPGLKLTGGVHIIKNNVYFIQNGSIQEERTRYNYAGPFLSLQLEPTSLLSFFDSFIKLGK